MLSTFSGNNAKQLRYSNLYSIFCRTVTSTSQKHMEQCYQLLNVPMNSKQDVIRKAFLELAKKYHPDSGSPDADMDKFVAIEKAFRTLTKQNTGNVEEAEKVVYDINVCYQAKQIGGKKKALLFSLRKIMPIARFLKT